VGVGVGRVGAKRSTPSHTKVVTACTAWRGMHGSGGRIHVVKAAQVALLGLRSRSTAGSRSMRRSEPFVGAFCGNSIWSSGD